MTYTPTISPSITITPTITPSIEPTFEPTNIPISPSFNPTINPTFNPSTIPTNSPSQYPTINPTTNPSIEPTFKPTKTPTISPSISPTNKPSIEPTTNPSIYPSYNPSIYPSYNPSFNPTTQPSTQPTTNPTMYPSINPTINPTISPTFSLPIPGILTVINGTNHSFTLHNSTVYMDHQTIIQCVMNIDNNNHLLNTSYVIIPYEYFINLQNINFLIASKMSIDILPSNCTDFPALKIIKHATYEINNEMYTKLFVIEAYFWEYFQTLDVNITNITIEGNKAQFESTDENIVKEFEKTTNLTNISYNTVSVHCNNLSNIECMKLYNDIYDIRRRQLEFHKSSVLSITPDFQFQMNGGDIGNGVGFKLKTGLNFYAKFTVSFHCKFNTWNGFEKFKFLIAMETLLNAYVNIHINNVNFQHKIKQVKTKPHCIWIGPIPITFELYAAFYLGIEIKDFEMLLGLQIGYNKIKYEYGVEYNKQNGWIQIDKGDKFKLNGMLNYNLDRSGGCEMIIQPSVQFRIGVVFYELIDAYVANVLTAPITLTYPANNGCGQYLDCLSTLNSLGIHIELWNELYIGMDIDNVKWYLKPVVGAIEPPPLKLGSWQIDKWDECMDIDSVTLYHWCCQTTITPRPTSQEIEFTPAPTDGYIMSCYIFSIESALIVNIIWLFIM
eukprot:213687_1